MLSRNIKGRPTRPQRALIYTLAQAMLISPLVSIHLPAPAVMLEGGGEWGGSDWGGGASEWGDYEGGWPDDGPDDAGDSSGSLDQPADAPQDSEEPDTSGPEASDEPAVDEEPADEDGGEEEEPKPDDPEECTGQVGNPINLARADKVEYQVDYRGRDRAALRVARVYHSNSTAYPANVNVRMGAGWRNFYDRSLQVLSGSQVRLHRYDGSVIDFTYSGAAWVGAQQAGSLSATSGGWQYVNPRNGVEVYSSNGKLVSLSRKGRLTSMQYDGAGRLSSVTNPFGRALVFVYDGLNRVSSITTPGAATLAYGYDADGNLASLTLPDGSVRRYVYENPSYRNALTGIVDESGRRIVSWGYDGNGRPNYNHFGNGINPLSISYGNAQVTTTDARGTVRTRTLALVGNRYKVSAITVGATTDSAATTRTFGFDGYGYVNRTIARSGAVHDAVHDARGRKLNQTRATGMAYAETAQRTWHPVFNTPTRTVRAGVAVDRTLDSQGRVTQVVRTGTNGVAYTTLQRSYNAQHLLASTTNARGGVTTHTYDSQGNRTSSTSPAGQTKTFSNFDAHGRPTRVVRADGSVVTRAFDLRGRLFYRAINGIGSTFSFDAANRLTQVTRADGSSITRYFDSAGRLASMQNHRGERVVLGRDVAGKIISRATYNAAGGLVHAGYTRYDKLGREAARIDTRGNAHQATYAPDGRPSGSVDPLGRNFGIQLDLLNRPTVLSQPNTTAMRQAGGAASVAATINWDNTIGAVRSAADTVNVGTGFGFDALNRRTAEVGADGGTRQWLRNVAGDALNYTDARGVNHAISRDTLGRITSVTGPSGAAMGYAYVPGRRDATLASMTDPSGTTAWTHDSEGRVLSKAQTVAGSSRQVTMTRDSLGRVSTMTYPSGMRIIISYSGDALASITVNGSVLMDNITYRPFTQVATGWRWGNGSTHQRTADADGRITSVTLGSRTRHYTYDPAGQIAEFNDVPASGISQRTSLAYDEAGQLTSYSGPGGSAAYAYDTNGNRRSQMRNGIGSALSYAAGSNRLLTSPRGQYSYAADGSVVSDGVWTFGYDAFGRMNTLSGFNPDQENYTRSFDGLGMRVRFLRRVFSSPYDFSGTAGAGAQTKLATSPLQSLATRPATAAPTTMSTSTRKTAAVRLGASDSARTGGDTPQATPGGGSWYITDDVRFLHSDAGQLLGEYNIKTGYSQETIWFNGQPVGAMINGVLYTVRSDHLGTPRSLARASDNLEVWRWDGEPFGDSFPVNPVAGQTITYNLRFAGQQYEPYTGYYQNWHRDYDPYTGRYLQADPLGLGGGLSRFTYVAGNPLSFTDPAGLWIYQQSSGNVYREGNNPSAVSLVGSGYSGATGFQNNGFVESLGNIGPIPTGAYTIGPQGNYTTGSNVSLPGTMTLTPQPGNWIYGRSGFLIHGDNARGNRSASQGCIILGRPLRDLIGSSSDNSLTVVP